MKRACSIRIYGHVFNVGFRRYVHRYAAETNVCGYVENDLADQCVHIEAEGKQKKPKPFHPSLQVRNSLLCYYGCKNRDFDYFAELH